MQSRLGTGIVLTIAATFGANHVAARVAFDHGASVATAVAIRSGCTALVLLFLLRFQGLSIRLPPAMLGRALVVGLLIAAQSFCLYSAVARIPVALALLVFQTCPMLFVLLSWAAGKERPRTSALLAMPVALLGLAFALGVRWKSGGEWLAAMGPGIAWALGAAICFTLVLFLNAHWLKGLDGRLRTFLMMSVTAVVVLAAGGLTGTLAAPADATGWLGLALLPILYGSGITTLFVVLPRLAGAASMVALNFEPIAVLGLAWLVLGQTASPLQVAGAFVVVVAIVWLGTRQPEKQPDAIPGS
jgi:drug/metabolite transporter (DMT)-like permease